MKNQQKTADAISWSHRQNTNRKLEKPSAKDSSGVQTQKLVSAYLSICLLYKRADTAY